MFIVKNALRLCINDFTKFDGQFPLKKTRLRLKIPFFA